MPLKKIVLIMDLKEKLISAYPTFETQAHTCKEISAIRKEALKNFEALGFPTKHEETWRYTSLRPVLKPDYSLLPKTTQTLTQQDINEYAVENIDSYTLVFVDGVFSPNLSTPTTEDITACSLSEAFQSDALKPIAQQYFNTVAPKDDSLSSLNTAFAHEGAFVHVKANTIADKPVQLLYFSTGNEQAIMVQPRNLVVVDENAHVQIIERHQSLGNNPTLTNTLTEVVVANYAVVDYYKIQNDQYTASLIDNTFVVQKDNSNFTSHTFSFGGKLTRNNLKASQEGSHTNTTFKGVTILEGKQHVDHITHVHHTQPDCESHQDYKGVFDEQSVGVFDGYILVDKIAQKTDGYQKSDNLLMSDKATAHAKPQLEIYADDVKCSHGCTVGQIDKEALFYLESRGIPKKEARALMMFAFSAKVLNSVKIPALRQRIHKQIALKLGVNIGMDD